MVFKKFIVLLIIFSIGAAVGFAYFTKTQRLTQSTQEEKNTPKAFLEESYDKIKNNFWDNISDAQLIELFKLAAEKNGSKPLSFKIESKEKLISEILSVQNDMSDEQKKKFIPTTLGTVLASLNPTGRSGLYTQKQEEQLKNLVENRNPETGKVEPTIFSKIVIPGILYVQFKKFSPTSLDEFQKVFETYKDDTNLYGLILDLRGNIGGAIDGTAYFLGFFLGKNQYAYDFYKKGEYLPFKTPTDKLPSISKYKQVVLLVDNNTQSSAEMMAASLKKYHVGVVVGVPTKGWGTVERVFPLDNQISSEEKYSMLLVHSITLRDDNQPIEGRGVEPDINIKDANWEQQLFGYFRNPQLTTTVKQVLFGQK